LLAERRRLNVSKKKKKKIVVVEEEEDEVFDMEEIFFGDNTTGNKRSRDDATKAVSVEPAPKRQKTE